VRQIEHQALERHRLRKQEALPELDAEGADTLALILRLDAFGENRQPPDKMAAAAGSPRKPAPWPSAVASGSGPLSDIG
jgi:hypothetical protein